ncbi:hypothetical protein Nepgr_028073 [Nepenthes gracilis]|uniref:Uncharacterized protein n=1 Tax=Nepenthes gracilis TaxID=150966 RepID=A0AAD3TB10_NEPGR|nr:hypothetical protein Nepgr_028073 [Nepenthes gracilis]
MALTSSSPRTTLRTCLFSPSSRAPFTRRPYGGNNLKYRSNSDTSMAFLNPEPPSQPRPQPLPADDTTEDIRRTAGSLWARLSPSKYRPHASSVISQITVSRKLPLPVGGSNSLVYALLADQFNPEWNVFNGGRHARLGDDSQIRTRWIRPVKHVSFQVELVHEERVDERIGSADEEGQFPTNGNLRDDGGSVPAVLIWDNLARDESNCPSKRCGTSSLSWKRVLLVVMSSPRFVGVEDFRQKPLGELNGEMGFFAICRPHYNHHLISSAVSSADSGCRRVCDGGCAFSEVWRVEFLVAMFADISRRRRLYRRERKGEWVWELRKSLL